MKDLDSKRSKSKPTGRGKHPKWQGAGGGDVSEPPAAGPEW